MTQSMRIGRSAAAGRRGMVATGHPLASGAALQVLAAGGNAVDAAVAAAGVLGVVQPMMSGLGGDTFMLVYRRREGRVWAVCGSGPAPGGATREYFVERGYAKMPLRGMLSVSVPGAVAAMEEALARWGSGRFPLSRLLEPAVRYAEEGAPVARRVAGWIRETAPVLARYPSSARIFLPGGRPPEEGDLLVQRDLAASLRAVAAGGAKAFYEGPIAERIGAYSRANGGLLTAQDLAGYRVEVAEPVRATFRGITVFTTPPPSQGFLLHEMLNILEDVDLGAWGSADWVHWPVEAKKLAFADRVAYLGDPRFVPSPLDRLLDSAHAARRRAEIDPVRAADAARGGLASEVPGDTTYFCVADVEGNLVSYITSLSAAFGCGEVVEGTGIMLNNRAGRGFELTAGHPNVIAPGKRTMHTLVPYMAFQGEAPWLVWGTPGGDAQSQWDLQVLLNLVAAGMGVQEAVEAPRWTSFPGTDPATIESPFELRMEEGFPAPTLAELERRGHRVQRQGPLGGGGGVQAIVVDGARGVYLGGSDPRTDGCAIGL
ncbi:MAG: gamma-glutamyltransferase [Armatimonadota bacterium]|nr:gamma-glutamyltransferase [Armatimonadota bacterium]MDR7496747.1 gamma-glutamyltransferase [Armatimonadota bacterium]MDR7511640.1 gamma-glutamyltransferase [Armatimonadota bacterium]